MPAKKDKCFKEVAPKNYSAFKFFSAIISLYHKKEEKGKGKGLIGLPDWHLRVTESLHIFSDRRLCKAALFVTPDFIMMFCEFFRMLIIFRLNSAWFCMTIAWFLVPDFPDGHTASVSSFGQHLLKTSPEAWRTSPYFSGITTFDMLKLCFWAQYFLANLCARWAATVGCQWVASPAYIIFKWFLSSTERGTETSCFDYQWAYRALFPAPPHLTHICVLKKKLIVLILKSSLRIAN